jgi:hypothetical protein
VRDLGAVGIFKWILFDLGDRTAGSVLHSEVGAHLTTEKNRFLSSEYSSSLILVCTLLNHSSYIYIYIYKYQWLPEFKMMAWSCVSDVYVCRIIQKKQRKDIREAREVTDRGGECHA